MVTFQLREAGPADAPAIVQVLHAAFEEYLPLLDPPSGVHRETPESVAGRMATGRWMLAEHDGRAVACVFYEPRESYVYLGRLAVLPQYRKQGIGRALIDFVEGRARELGPARVRLGVRLALAELRARYERMGYRVVEYHTHAGCSQPTFVSLEKELERREMQAPLFGVSSSISADEIKREGAYG
jgi:GNAT superfamily N-acetyltransferase